jgi:hypothetical protein
MKELTRSYGELLQDKRVRSEQNKYESFTRQRNTVMTRYRKVHTAFTDLLQGLSRAEAFYSEMKDTVSNLEKNVETFVNNRREEGGQLLGSIERKRQAASGENADRERERLRELMERMNVGGGNPTPSPPQRTKSSASRPPQLQGQPQPPRSSQPSTSYPYSNPPTSPPYNAKPPTGYPSSHSPAPQQNPYSTYAHAHHQMHPSAAPSQPQSYDQAYSSQQPQHTNYDPMSYPYTHAAAHQRSPPTTQPHMFGHPPPPPPGMNIGYAGYPQQHGHSQLPQDYIPPPPPPGPPPGASSGTSQYSPYGGAYGQPIQGRPTPQPERQSGNGPPGGDPWAGLGAWK